MNTDSPLKRLAIIGFRHVGEWGLDDGKVLLHLHDCESSSNILYCFVMDGKPVYVGKTIQSLRRRLYGYQNPGPTQSTNQRGNQKIRESLNESRSIEIYALPDHGLLNFGGFHLNLAAGLEDSIVAALRPAWNMMGMGKS